MRVWVLCAPPSFFQTGWTPLISAASDGLVEVVKALLGDPSIDIHKANKVRAPPSSFVVGTA